MRPPAARSIRPCPPVLLIWSATPTTTSVFSKFRSATTRPRLLTWSRRWRNSTPCTTPDAHVELPSQRGEALTALGQVDEAEPLVPPRARRGPTTAGLDARDGCTESKPSAGCMRRTQCRRQAALEAMGQHRRLPMPSKGHAPGCASASCDAGGAASRRPKRPRVGFRTFERLGTRLWAKHAEAEIERVNVPVADGIG